MISICLAAAVAVASAAVAPSPTKGAVDRTRTAESSEMTSATAWLAAIDQQRFADSWDMAGTLFRSQLSKAAWAAAVRPVREPLGQVASRVVKTMTTATSLPGVPDGEYRIIQYTTSFARKKNATETLVLAREPTGWKVVGYFIR